MYCDLVERYVYMYTHVHGAEASLQSALIHCGVYVYSAGTWIGRMGRRKRKGQIARDKRVPKEFDLFKDIRRIISDLLESLLY